MASLLPRPRSRTERMRHDEVRDLTANPGPDLVSGPEVDA